VPNALPEGGRPSPPSFSVIVTAFTFDRLPSIAEIVDSLEQQTVAPLEVLLVIDYADDLLAECRRLWPGVRVIPNEGWRGSCGARNTGVAHSRGEVVAFLDDDAVPVRDWIERLGDAYRDERVVAVGGGVFPRWVAGRPSWFPAEFDWVVGCMHSGTPKQREAVRNVIAANMSVRREDMLAIGGLREEFSRIEKNAAGGEETDLCIRLAKHRPDSLVVYDPAASVEHIVPPERGEVRYYVSRSFAEGRSKAALASLVGSDAGLSDERAYVRKTLPLGVARYLRQAAGGDTGGIARAGMIVLGLSATVAGYATASRRPAAAAAAETDPDRDLRVLMVTPRSPLLQGGVERHVAEVSKRIAAAGAEVEVLCSEPGGPALQEEELDGVRVRTVRAWPRNRDYYFAPGLWREMARRPWDVIHVQSYHTLVAPLAMLRALILRVPYVVTFHGGGHTSEVRNRLRPLQRLLMRPLLRRAARLVAVARFEIDQYGEELGLPPERFALIPNGIDLSFAEARQQPRNGTPVIASVGRLERYKGHHRVIAAFPTVLAGNPQARLLIVGSGPYEGELRRQVDELNLGDRVEFTSVPADRPAAMAELLSRVNVMALLSGFETHPLAAIEAAAAGCRLLVADSGGLRELVEDGIARPVPLEESPAAVGAALLEEVGQPPPERMPTVLSWDESAQKLMDLYREVA
jgi:glycosyltransferase involved in cell wall biosynthesis